MPKSFQFNIERISCVFLCLKNNTKKLQLYPILNVKYHLYNIDIINIVYNFILSMSFIKIK